MAGISIESIDALMSLPQPVEVTVTPEVALQTYGDQDSQRRTYPNAQRWQAKVLESGSLGLLVEVYTPIQASGLFLPWTAVLTVRLSAS